MDIVRCFVDRDEDQEGPENDFYVANARSEPPHNDAGSDSESDSGNMSGDSLSDDSFHPELGGEVSGPITPPPKKTDLQTSPYGLETPQSEQPKTSQFGKETLQSCATSATAVTGGIWGGDVHPPARQPLGAVPGATSQGNGAMGVGGRELEMEGAAVTCVGAVAPAAAGVGRDAGRTE